MRKVYGIRIETSKDGGDGLREFEVAKGNEFEVRMKPLNAAFGFFLKLNFAAELFRNKFEDVNSKLGRRKKCDIPLVEADLYTVLGMRMLNDHDYCKNICLETF